MLSMHVMSAWAWGGWSRGVLGGNKEAATSVQAGASDTAYAADTNTAAAAAAATAAAAANAATALLLLLLLLLFIRQKVTMTTT